MGNKHSTFSPFELLIMKLNDEINLRKLLSDYLSVHITMIMLIEHVYTVVDH